MLILSNILVLCMYFSNLVKIFLRLALSILNEFISYQKDISNNTIIVTSCSFAMNSKLLLINIVMINVTYKCSISVLNQFSYFD